MSQYVDVGHKTFTNGATAIDRYRRVKFDTGVLVVAGLERALGVTRNHVPIGEPATVILPSKAGTIPMVAAGIIAQGANVYGAAAGEVSATQGIGAFLEGVALEAAAAQGDIIEVLPIIGETVGV